ncbi:MAG: ABC transporter ATP-binding protein, partial [Dietzia psychralcaliphila]
QMLAMGRALVARPTFLLLDEPSLGLAPRIVQQIRDIIVEINSQGTGVLLVEQNAAMALSIARHGYVVETGRVVMDGPAADLLANDDIREFYLGARSDSDEAKSYRNVKQYRRRKRWAS